MFLRLDRVPTWIVEEAPWQPERNAVWESLFTLANGYLGIRGFPEEQFDSGPTRSGIYIAGVFNPGADGVPELVNVTNFMATEIALAEEMFRMSPERVSEYRRVLDLKRGILQRSLVYTYAGRSTRLEFERFVSIARPHRAVQSVTITPLNWSGRVAVWLWLDSHVINEDRAHLRLLHSQHMGRDWILLATETDQTRVRIAHACRCASWIHQEAPLKPRLAGNGNRIGFQYETTLECGQQARFDRVISTFTSNDSETTSVERCCLEDVRGVAEMKGVLYGVRRRRHIEAWARRWEDADIVIDGPEEDQRAVRFSIFHLIQSCPPRDATVSIAAKGLTGEGYRGHVFWDTEIFMLPFFLCTDPPVAKRLLQYRWHTLEGAIRKAKASGYQGAMFAWESAGTGDETCPPYVPDPRTGERVRVLTGELQHHISADVVYAARQYVQATGDIAFQERELLTLSVLTARFWASRIAFNQAKGRCEICGVIGPDEYHERVANNAFTNFMAAENLRIATLQVEHMRKVHGRSHLLRDLRVTEQEVRQWKAIAKGMYLPKPSRSGIWEQYEGFFKLQKTDPCPLSALVSEEPEKDRMVRIHRAQVLKQADVLMLMVLFPKAFPRNIKQANWDYYERRTTHDSSLSPSIHSIAASDLGLRRHAYDYFRRSAFLDLHDIMGNTYTGLHCGAMGGTWQAVVRGFLGLDLDGPRPQIRMRLPKAWKRVSMRIQHRGRWYVVDTSAKKYRVRLCP